VILTCHSYVTVYRYPRYSHLKSLASYFGLQVSRTYPHVYYSFLLRTSAIQSLTQTPAPTRLMGELLSTEVYFNNFMSFFFFEKYYYGCSIFMVRRSQFDQIYLPEREETISF